MRINKKLNLVIPVELDNSKTVYVHSTPISREVFEKYYKVIGRTLAAIFEQGLGRIAGPRTSALLMMEQAEEMGGNTPEAKAAAIRDVEDGLFNEIYRLTNVAVPGERGWDNIPYSEAIKKSIINRDDAAEVKNALAFFTVTSSMMKGRDLEAALEGSKLWGGSIVSLNCTEYANSLPTSTVAENSGVKNPTLPQMRLTG